MLIQEVLARLIGDCKVCLADGCHYCSSRALFQITPTKLILGDEHNFLEALKVDGGPVGRGQAAGT